MIKEENIAMVGDTIDAIFIYPNGVEEPVSFYLYDFNSEEEIPTYSLPVQSPIGLAVYKKAINTLCSIMGSNNKIIITDIHKRCKNMGHSR